MKFPPFLHSHLRLTLLGTPPNRVFSFGKNNIMISAIYSVVVARFTSLSNGLSNTLQILLKSIKSNRVIFYITHVIPYY